MNLCLLTGLRHAEYSTRIITGRHCGFLPGFGPDRHHPLGDGGTAL